jgi:hypothetical protein
MSAISKDDRIDDLPALHATPHRKIATLLDDHEAVAP